MTNNGLRNPINDTIEMPSFYCRDQFGRISIYRFENIIISEFSGPCSNRIVKQYFAALLSLIEKVSPRPWGYLSVSHNFEAVTEYALATLDTSFERSIKMGCAADAYVIDSALGKEQLRSLRVKYVTEDTLSDVLFESFDDAFRYLSNKISLITET